MTPEDTAALRRAKWALKTLPDPESKRSLKKANRANLARQNPRVKMSRGDRRRANRVKRLAMRAAAREAREAAEQAANKARWAIELIEIEKKTAAEWAEWRVKVKALLLATERCPIKQKVAEEEWEDMWTKTPPPKYISLHDRDQLIKEANYCGVQVWRIDFVNRSFRG